MRGRVVTAGVGVLLLAGSLASTGRAQETSTEDLRKEIQALRESVEAMQKDLQEIKSLLTRPAPRPSAIGAVVDYGSSPVRGAPDAKVTLLEISDYQCPYCARYTHDTLPQVEKEYIETGKVKSVFLDLPLERIHKLAFKAAEAARCAGDQGRYWEMHDRLFANQKALEPWDAHAEAIGLDVKAFDACMTSNKHAEGIRRDIASASKLGVTGTPGFLLGLTDPKTRKVRIAAAIRGSRPFADFKAEIDKLLGETPTAEAEDSEER